MTAAQSHYTCVDCTGDSRFPSVEELEIHIASDHLNYCPYECDRCRFAKFPTEYALISHYENDHGLREFFVRFRYNPEVKRKTAELRQKLNDSLRCSRENREEARPSGSGANWPAGHSHSTHSVADKLEDDSDSFSSTADRVPSRSASGQDGNVVASPPAADIFQQLNAQQQQGISGLERSQLELFVQQQNSYFNPSDMGMLGGAQLNLAGHNQFLSSTGKIPSPLDITSTAFGTPKVNFNAIIGEAQAQEMTKKPKDVVTCQVCGLKVSNQRSSLVYHANTKHIKLNLYECSACHKTWQTIAKSDVVRHVRAMHDGDESLIMDNRKKLGYQLRMCTAKCFPPKPSTKPRPLTQGTSPPHGDGGECSHQASTMMMNFNPDSASQILNSFLVPKIEDPAQIGQMYDARLGQGDQAQSMNMDDTDEMLCEDDGNDVEDPSSDGHLQRQSASHDRQLSNDNQGMIQAVSTETTFNQLT